MSEERSLEIQVRIENSMAVIHIQVTTTNTFQQIVDSLRQESEQFQEFNQNDQLIFVDGTGQICQIQDNLGKIKPNEGIYIVTIKKRKKMEMSDLNFAQKQQQLETQIKKGLKFLINNQFKEFQNLQKSQIISNQLFKILKQLSNSLKNNNKNQQGKEILKFFNFTLKNNNIINYQAIDILDISQELKQAMVKYVNCVDILESQLKQAKRKQSQLQSDRDKSSLQISDLKNKMSHMISNKKQQNSPKISDLENLIKNNKDIFERQLKKAQSQIQQRQKIISNIKMSTQRQKQLNQALIKDLQKKIIEEQEKNRLIIGKSPNALFIFSKILFKNNYKDQKFLVHAIEEEQSRKIQQTKLLYSFDPLNLANFHAYIDGHPHILLILETKQKFIIGAYSQSALMPGKQGSKGFLLSLNNLQKYPLKNENYKSTVYDPYFLIFGKDDIYLQQNSKYLEIGNNFGENEGAFDIPAGSINKFVGKSIKGKKIQIQHYQIFEIILED